MRYFQNLSLRAASKSTVIEEGSINYLGSWGNLTGQFVSILAILPSGTKTTLESEPMVLTLRLRPLVLEQVQLKRHG